MAKLTLGKDWEETYASNVKKLPGYSKKLDSDLNEELKKQKINKGTFLDLETGPGTQAMKNLVQKALTEF